LGLGPTIGSAVFEYLEYKGTMYLFGVLNLGAMIFAIIFIPGIFN